MLARANRIGNCPYCGSTDFDTSKTEAKVPNIQDVMFCGSCDQWSMRLHRNGVQYPLQDPLDKLSSPTVMLKTE